MQAMSDNLYANKHDFSDYARLYTHTVRLTWTAGHETTQTERRRSGLRGKELRGNAARGSELRGNGARPAWQTRITHFYAVSANYGFGFL